jgi:hypothetical protein
MRRRRREGQAPPRLWGICARRDGSPLVSTRRACRSGRWRTAAERESWRTVRRSETLMRTLDPMNAQFGRDMIRPLSAGIEHSWRMKQAQQSPRYTTQWGGTGGGDLAPVWWLLNACAIGEVCQSVLLVAATEEVTYCLLKRAFWLLLSILSSPANETVRSHRNFSSYTSVRRCVRRPASPDPR